MKRRKSKIHEAIGLLNQRLDGVPKINGKPQPHLKTLDEVLRVVSKQLWKELQKKRRRDEH